jgi:hypothetical protein
MARNDRALLSVPSFLTWARRGGGALRGALGRLTSEVSAACYASYGLEYYVTSSGWPAVSSIDLQQSSRHLSSS